MLETGVFEGRMVWFLWNQTTAGENFCEKWNEHPQKAGGIQGLDQVRRRLGVPWTSLWLFHFEGWLASNEWRGIVHRVAPGCGRSF